MGVILCKSIGTFKTTTKSANVFPLDCKYINKPVMVAKYHASEEQQNTLKTLQQCEIELDHLYRAAQCQGLQSTSRRKTL